MDRTGTPAISGPRGKDDAWTWDFIFDRTSDGRSLKWLSIVDEYTRGCLVLAARRGMTVEDIRGILAEVAAGRGGPPCRMRSDNGPEFVAEVVRSWLEDTGSGTWPNRFLLPFPPPRFLRPRSLETRSYPLQNADDGGVPPSSPPAS